MSELEPSKNPGGGGGYYGNFSRDDCAEMFTSYIGGSSQYDLAEVYGVNQSTISRALARYMEDFGEEELREARKKDLVRLEALIDRHWKPALRKGDKESAKLVVEMIKTRARFIGYEAPTRVEHGGEVRHVVIEPEVAAALERIEEQNAEIVDALEQRAIAPREEDIEEAEVVDGL